MEIPYKQKKDFGTTKEMLEYAIEYDIPIYDSFSNKERTHRVVTIEKDNYLFYSTDYWNEEDTKIKEYGYDLAPDETSYDLDWYSFFKARKIFPRLRSDYRNPLNDLVNGKTKPIKEQVKEILNMQESYKLELTPNYKIIEKAIREGLKLTKSGWDKKGYIIPSEIKKDKVTGTYIYTDGSSSKFTEEIDLNGIIWNIHYTDMDRFIENKTKICLNEFANLEDIREYFIPIKANYINNIVEGKIYLKDGNNHFTRYTLNKDWKEYNSVKSNLNYHIFEVGKSIRHQTWKKHKRFEIVYANLTKYTDDMRYELAGYMYGGDLGVKVFSTLVIADNPQDLSFWEEYK